MSTKFLSTYDNVMQQYFIGLWFEFLVGVENVGSIVGEIAEREADRQIGEPRFDEHHVIE